jgi:hypothetical protein
LPNENEAHSFPVDDSKVEVWCDGREYDPDDEMYRPVYSYKITTPDWEYIDNDIRGAVNELPDNDSAARSLFAFLYACQEGLPKDIKAEGENARLFPPHVREWAYQHSDDIELLYDKLMKGVK